MQYVVLFLVKNATVLMLFIGDKRRSVTTLVIAIKLTEKSTRAR